jgi:D-alanine-D-alanine ligase
VKILVLGGGISPERQVSLRSAKYIADAARDAGYMVESADPAVGPSVLDGLKDTIVFPILHGKNGEDGYIQKELEKRQLPFLGSGSLAATKCFDKWETRAALKHAGIPVPEGELVDERTYLSSTLLQEPYVLKVVHGGSSIGVLLARQPEKITEYQVSEIFAMEDKAIIEKLIVGVEVTVPILDGRALPVIEIVPPPNGEFDYENKYNGKTDEICPPKSVNHELQLKVQALAEKAHAITGCRHMSRVDLMIDKNDNLYVLEVNVIPGLTDQSLYPKAAAVDGLPMPELINRFVGLVARDYNLSLKKG